MILNNKGITKVWLDEKKKRCIICGLCELISPDVFLVAKTMTVKKNVDFNLFAAQIKDAVEGCPQNVIKMEERK